MTTTLARPVARYIAGANAQDIQAVTACFAEELDGEKIARLEIS